MYAVEFQTQVTDGTIEVPSEYRQRVKGTVRVIILAEETAPEIDMIEHLLAHPIHAPGFVPMKRDEIYQRSSES